MPTTNYGIPYKGSKSRIVDEIAEAIPYVGIDNFYDIFAGGCAVTHKMMLAKRYKHFYANDLDGQGLRLFLDAIAGKFHDEKRWISREDFLRLKDTDPYVACCWSFGNNQQSYMYAKELEPWKKALHYARVLGDLSLFSEMGIDSDGSRKDIINHKEEYKQAYIRWWLSQQEYTAEELDALIAKCKGDIAVQEEELRQYLLRGLKSSGLTQAEVGRRLGTQMTGHYFGRSQWEFPTQEYYEMMQTFMPALDQDYNEVVGLARLWESLEYLQSLQILLRLQSLEYLQSPETLQSLESLQHIERIERLQSLESLERLQSLQRLESSFLDYRDVEIKPNSIIYCDPPYKDTDGYNDAFDHEPFYDWCCRQSELVVVSEYTMPADRFTEVYAVKHRSLYSQTVNNAVIERLFVPTCQLHKYKELMMRHCCLLLI